METQAGVSAIEIFKGYKVGNTVTFDYRFGKIYTITEKTEEVIKMKNIAYPYDENEYALGDKRILFKLTNNNGGV